MGEAAHDHRSVARGLGLTLATPGVVPAQAGTQCIPKMLNARLRGHDNLTCSGTEPPG